MTVRQRLLSSLMAIVVVASVAAIAVVTAVAGLPAASSAAVPRGFQEQIVLAGLNRPTAVRFSPDGRIFVAEKRGVIKVFQNLADTNPTVFADLTVNVHNSSDRGLLGLALPPDFPANPWVYVLYSYDAPLGGTAPVYNDNCGELANLAACVISGRLSRLRANGDTMTGTEQVLISDWCQQYTSHSVGDLAFGPDGALYVTGGEGANFSAADYGQFGTPPNPCGDPVNEGGALRAQDVRTSGDPTGLSGALLRLDPNTGAAMPSNANAKDPDLNTRRIVAYGLRNPFRMTIRPGTNEVWVADVGWSRWEEINRVVSPTAPMTNFGWPCFEGPERQPAFEGAGLPLCTSLYGGTQTAAPYYSWRHGKDVVPGDGCGTGGSSATGVAFYPNSGPYPAAYRGALFFADYSRNCIWAMKAPSAGALPNPANVETFVTNAAGPVDLQIGPGGELYYVDLNGGTIRRLRYYDGNVPPIAAITASPTSGQLPLTVNFDGSGSTDPDPADAGRLTYGWDFTNDGTIDATGDKVSFTYTTPGVYTARLRVTDTVGATNDKTITILAGVGAPVATIDSPAEGTTWATGDTINFSGHATDAQDGDIPASKLSWQVRLQHCATLNNCHQHVLADFVGASGSFIAPDHEYPSYVELALTATDSKGLSHTTVRRLDPKTVDMTFVTSPPGLNLTVGTENQSTPFTLRLIQGSTTTVSAPTPQIISPNQYNFAKWSDSGAQTHVITAPAAPSTLTATYSSTPVTNLALNKVATGTQSCSLSETPDKAVNGSWSAGITDWWCGSPSVTDKWLQVDLGKSYTVNSIVVRHSGAGGQSTGWNTKDYDILLSSDGSTWRTGATVRGNTADVTTSDVSGTARYVKLRIITPSNSGNLAARIFELEVLGSAGSTQPDLTNLALNRPATGTQSCSLSETPDKAVNGSWTNGITDWWCGSPQVTDKWLQVDLGAKYKMNSVLVRHAGAGGQSTGWNTKDYDILLSDDGSTWRTGASVRDNTANVTTSPVTGTARYVKLKIITPSNSGNLAARIFELEVMGSGPEPDLVNLALNKPATGTQSCSLSEGPDKAVNGSWTNGITDWWCGSPSVTDKWLQVDLGKSYTLDSVVVRHAGAGGQSSGWNTKDYDILLSDDGSTWRTGASVWRNSADVTTSDVTGTARYVKLKIITPSNSGNLAARIFELEVMGPGAPPPQLTNVARGKPATGTQSCSLSETPDKAVNGSWTGGTTDWWCGSPQVTDKWLQVDLGKSYALNSVVVRHAGAGGQSAGWNTKDYDILVSQDGTNWTTAASVRDNTANVTTSMVSNTARYVRLKIITPSNSGNLAARIFQLEVLAPAS
ncbi:discoidin domain-containing protein [Dactylosporangium sp. NPDC048998]|uniref:galactose-binding domain-containing protein n=1 Tax=Dactylosporangium sp. NPDC048998 TaxID=3363976 RepID=UPI0037149F2E